MERKIDVTVKTRPIVGRLRPATKITNIAIPDRDLREQLRLEIETKSKVCSNPTYDCSVPRIDGYDYCMRHILRDPRCFYRQCGYIYPNGKKCFNALQKYDTKKDPAMTIYCFEHSRKAQLTKTRTAVGRLLAVDTNDVMFQTLAYHLKVDEPKPSSTVEEGEEVIDVESPQVAPFVHYNQVNELSSLNKLARKRRRVLDYASDSSSNGDDPPNLSNTLCGVDNFSDNESTESLNEDLLKHANIFTRQEVICISEAKLTKLQGLYIEQINHLRYTLKERRHRYLLALRKEREYLCSINSQPKETLRERKLYAKLKALSEYHRRRGISLILYRKFKEKRTRFSEGVNYRIPNFGKCIFTEGGVKCGGRVVPSMKYCRKHTLEDKKQAMFQACGVESSSVVCQEPVPIIYEELICTLHLALPRRWHYVQKKFDSDTEDDDGSADIKIVEVAPDKPLEQLKDETLAATSATPSGSPIETSVVNMPLTPTDKQLLISPTKSSSSERSLNITIAHDIPTELGIAAATKD